MTEVDLDYFNEFVTLARHGSFVSASRNLNMSQSALSRHIDALEKHLNQKLIFDTRPLRLTVAGETVLKHSGKLIRDYQNMLVELDKLPRHKNDNIVIQDILHANVLFIGINEAVRIASQEFGTFQLDYLNVDDTGLNARQLIKEDKVDISFETTMSTNKLPTLDDLPDDLKGILIPEFHGNIVMGIPRDNPLASKEKLYLSDFSHERFIMQMNLLSDRFIKDFAVICGKKGFYPNVSFVPANSLEFYSSDPGDGIHILVAVSKKFKPLIADMVKQHVTVRSIQDEGIYGNAFAIVRKERNNDILNFLVQYMEERSLAFIESTE